MNPSKVAFGPGLHLDPGQFCNNNNAMAKKRKLFAGNGAKCTILTKFIHPKQTEQQGHRTSCTLTGKERKKVNKKQQWCYLFVDDNGVSCHAVKSHFIVVEEGESFFDAEEAQQAIAEHEANTASEFKEPKIKWRKSEARKLLERYLIEGLIPIENDGTMSIDDIYSYNPEFSHYDPEKFPVRLASLRSTLKDHRKRAEEDLLAFQNYKKNHQPSLFTHQGFVQWQGSNAQELLWDDIEAGHLNTMTIKELYESRDEYQAEFPLKIFRKKVEQEQRTSKYIKTITARGIPYRAS